MDHSALLSLALKIFAILVDDLLTFTFLSDCGIIGFDSRAFDRHKLGHRYFDRGTMIAGQLIAGILVAVLRSPDFDRG